MKRLLLLLAAIALLSGCKPAKTIEGAWKGNVTAGGMSLPLVVTFTKASDGKYSGNLESPQQAKGVTFTVDTVTYEEDKVHFEVQSVKGSFDGKLSEDGKKLDGQWKQLGQSVPLSMTKSEPAANG